MKRFDVTFLFKRDQYADIMDLWGDEDDGCITECEDYDCCGVGCRIIRALNRSDEAGFDSGSEFHRTGFTKVSKFFAFDLMPKLKLHTYRYED